MKLYQRFNREGKLTSPYWWCSFGVDGHVYRKSTKQRTCAKAETVAHALMAKTAHDPSSMRGRVPRLEEELKRFGEWVENNQSLRPATREYYAYGCSMLRNTKLAAMKLDRITKEHVASTVLPGGPSCQNVAIRALRRLMSVAHEEGRLPNPPKLKLRREEKRTLLFTDEIEQKMLPLLPRDTGFVIQFIRDTGARPGKVFALRWEHLNWEARTYGNPGGKTPSAQRTLLLSERIMMQLHERHLVQGTPAAGWVLPNSRSKSGHIEYISEYSFRRARKQLNLPSNLVLYCARHDYGTNAMIATGNISVVGKLMGHNSVTMTARYSHPPESESQRIRALIDSRLCTLSAHGVVPIDSTTRKQRVN